MSDAVASLPGLDSTNVVVRFSSDPTPETLELLATALGGVGSVSIYGQNHVAPEVGSVVLTMSGDLVPERSWVETLLHECVVRRETVGIGVVDQNGVIVHAGAADVMDGGDDRTRIGHRPFGAGCRSGESPLFSTDRFGAGLLEPHAQFVSSPGQGASALINDRVTGRFLGSIVARSEAAPEAPVHFDVSVGSAVPNAVLVVGSTGEFDRDLALIETGARDVNIVWLAGSALIEKQTVLGRRCVFAFDRSIYTADTLACAFEVGAVLHLDDSLLRDDAAVVQLLRARPGIPWGVSNRRCDPRLLGRVECHLDEGTMGAWLANPKVPTAVTSRRIAQIEPVTARAGVVSVVIPVHGKWDLTERCLQSLGNDRSRTLEIIVVDDASPDETPSRLAERSDVVVVTNPRNLGFPGAVNAGLEVTTGEFVCVLNNDTEVVSGWLDEMLSVLAIDNTLLAGPRSNEISGLQRVQDGPRLLDRKLAHRWAHHWSRNAAGRSWRTNRIVGFCLLALRETFERNGCFDEAFGRGNFEDDDLCDRLLLAGGDLRVADGAVVLHHGSATFASLDEDYVATLASAARNRSPSRPPRTGAILGVVLSDGDVAATERSAWSMLGLTDHIRVVERDGADSTQLRLGRGRRVGVEVVSADWRTTSGAEAALSGVSAEKVLIVMSGETLEVTDWGAARSEIECLADSTAALMVDEHGEVRVFAMEEDALDAIGSPCDETLENLRICRGEAADDEVDPDLSAPLSESTVSVSVDEAISTPESASEPESVSESVPDREVRFITAVVLSDGEASGAVATLASTAVVADAAVLLERGAAPVREVGGPDSEIPADLEVGIPVESFSVDWTDPVALGSTLGNLKSEWILVLEAGERVLLDPVRWAGDLCSLPIGPVGVRVGDRAEVRLAPHGPDALESVGTSASVVSDGLRIVPAELEHGDVIGLRFPELAAASSIRAALAGRAEWAERLEETLVLDEEYRILQQIRSERPITWDDAAPVATVGVVVAYDPSATRFGNTEPNALGRLSDTLQSVLRQSHECTEVVVVTPPDTPIPAAMARGVRVVEHFGLREPTEGPFEESPGAEGTLPEDEPAVARLAKLVNLGTSVVEGDWICLVDVGDCLRYDHVEHLLQTAREDQSEIVHGLAVSYDSGAAISELCADRQSRTGAFGPLLFYGELRALQLRSTSWRIPEYPAANRTARMRVLGAFESAAEMITCSRPLEARTPANPASPR